MLSSSRKLKNPKYKCNFKTYKAKLTKVRGKISKLHLEISILLFRLLTEQADEKSIRILAWCDMSASLGWTSFPVILFLACFQFLLATWRLFGQLKREGEVAAILKPTHHYCSSANYLVNRKQQLGLQLLYLFLDLPSASLTPEPDVHF